MEATLPSKTLNATSAQTKSVTIQNTKSYKKGDTSEFFSGIFYILKKLFLIG